MVNVIRKQDLKSIFVAPKNLLTFGKEEEKQEAIDIFIESFAKVPSDELKLVIIDTKNKLGKYDNDPRLLMPRITDSREGAKVIEQMVAEMDHHFEMLAQACVKDIINYNKEAANQKKMPFIKIIIDDLENVMAFDGVEHSIVVIAQKGKAAGFNVFMTAQNPSWNVLTGLIKSNIDEIFAFSLENQLDRHASYLIVNTEEPLATTFEDPLYKDMVDYIFGPDGAKILMEKFNIEYSRANEALEKMKDAVKRNS